MKLNKKKVSQDTRYFQRRLGIYVDTRDFDCVYSNVRSNVYFNVPLFDGAWLLLQRLVRQTLGFVTGLEGLVSASFFVFEHVELGLEVPSYVHRSWLDETHSSLNLLLKDTSNQNSNIISTMS